MTTAKTDPSSPAPAVSSDDGAESAARPRLWRGVISSLPGRIGVVLGLFVLAVILFGRFFTPYDPTAINLAPPYSGPSAQHWLGTDALGRDLLSRLLTGGDQILLLPLIAVTIAYVIGGGLGFIGAYRGGRIDDGIRRFFDLIISMPVLLLALVAIAALNPSFWVLVLVIVVADIPRAGRTVRAAAHNQIAQDYVTAAQARGESMWAVLFREIAPNIVAPIASDFGLRLTYGIIAIATLSFLGLGAQPPAPDWGLMINENRGALTFAPLCVAAPAIAIALLSISFNLIAEAISQHITGDSPEDK